MDKNDYPSWLYPSWLNIEEPYYENGKWICPYCKREFDNKENAYPFLVMSFSKYQDLITSSKYADIHDFIEKSWKI